MNKTMTIKDIAILCGVSKSTVSRVINNESGVNSQTREKIINMMAKQQFTPSVAARGLKGHNKQVIGVIVTRLDSNAENQAVRAILAFFVAKNIEVMLLESQFDSNNVNAHLAMLFSRQVDGVIIFSFSDLKITQADYWQHKTVIVSQPIKNFVSICYDNNRAVELLFENFIQKQYQQIGYIGIDKKDKTTGKQRSKCYIALCKKYKIPPQLVLGEYSPQSGYNQLSALLKCNPTIDALICATDMLALGASKYCQAHNINLTIAYIGSNQLLSFIYPTLDYVHLGFYHSGLIAAEKLLLLLDKKINHHIDAFIVPALLN